MSEMKRKTIIVVGAGISGLSAANRLFQCGYENVRLFEASNVIGGRISTTPFGDGWVEMGAQWIHGEEDNIAYATAVRHNLLDKIKDKPEFSANSYMCEDGTQIDTDLANRVLDYLEDSLDRSTIEFLNKEYDTLTIDDYLNREMQQMIEKESPTPQVKAQMVALLKLFKATQCSIEGCDSLSELSTESYTRYKECKGDPLTNFSHGYSSLVKTVAATIPTTAIHLNKPVVELSLLSDKNGVRVRCADSTEHYADHVIMTASLGFLKQNARTMFHPPLSPAKLTTIEKLGFGTVNKIFLEFERPFWSPLSTGYSLMWKDTETFDDPNHWWGQGIFGFITVPFASNVLCGWITGHPARHMETLSDDQVMSTSLYILSRFTGITNLPTVKSIRRSRWNNQPYVRGSYSYVNGNQMENEEMSKPICRAIGGVETPLILFAGEATHPHYYSTVHGAMETGLREADRIIKLDPRSKEDPIVTRSNL